MSFPAVFTFDPRLMGHDQGSVAEVRVENQRSCIPEGLGLRSGAGRLRQGAVGVEEELESVDADGGTGVAGSTVVKERQQWLGLVRGPDSVKRWVKAGDLRPAS